ncbi:uncharacterized protein [Physcomitrium patens]|uniref:Uncharacterized protein n=1 Tax=Physcomitrium patens TaxID=3218 RepID=A0A2K1L9Y0_PHYPA|nr:uncharacterized protein LOC112281277 [Physcomitrium patens]PNR62830.1 hypothetical protein PHYPA_001254 [Physcomitrium patens]|eukprot:XP_024373373.1 uncharacterized protein LOC112281277 [Physcomitrella patens]
MKNVGVDLVLAILVCVFLAAGAAAEGHAFAQTKVFVADRKDFTNWSAVIVGKVFCDRCIQNKVFPFAHPMSKAKVSVQCKDWSGRVVGYARTSTNFLGDFIVQFKGKKDLSGCSVYLDGSSDRSCNIIGGGRRAISLKSKFLFQAFYVADPLFYKPARPMGFCPKKSRPSRGRITVPFPNRRPSTCSYLDWLRPDYRCYWPKDLSPWKTSVGRVFGRGAQKKYGNKPLAGGLLTGDDLLRQAITALLNSRTNKHFYMSPRGIKAKFSKALSGSWKAKSAQANAFRNANNGYGKGKCLLVPCKW